MELPEITEVQRLQLRPGDRLIVRTDTRLDMATADRIKRYVKDVFGEDVPVLVLDKGAGLEVMAAEEGA